MSTARKVGIGLCSAALFFFIFIIPPVLLYGRAIERGIPISRINPDYIWSNWALYIVANPLIWGAAIALVILSVTAKQKKQ